MNDVKLSICVPTYNGANTIERCLISLLEARKGFEDEVEIIVSDNASTDGTYQIVSSLTEKNFFVYRNNVNEGYNRNLFKLIDEYSKGEFIWTVGDDDLISKHSIELFMKYYSQMDILLIENEMLSDNRSQNNASMLLAYNMPFYKAIDRIAKGSNVLATFMTCAIYRRETINKCDKTNIQDNDWNTYSKVFPSGYLLNIGFCESDKVYCADGVYVYNIPNTKQWDDKLLHLQSKTLPEFYLDVCKKKDAYKMLKRTKLLLIKSLFKISFLHKKIKYRLNAIKFLCLILTCRPK